MGDEKHRLKNQLAERACRPAAESMAQHWPDLGSSRRRRRSFFGFVPEGTPPRSQRNLLGGVEAG